MVILRRIKVQLVKQQDTARQEYTDKSGTQPVSMLFLTEVGPLLMMRQFVKLVQVLKLWHLSQGNNSFLSFFLSRRKLSGQPGIYLE